MKNQLTLTHVYLICAVWIVWVLWILWLKAKGWGSEE